MITTTISAAEWRIDTRLRHLADAEHWDITPRLLNRIIREAGRAANLGRPVSIEQPGKSAAARKTRLAVLERSVPPVVVAVGRCHREACGRPAAGWRLYVAGGWLAVCVRHLGGAKAIGCRVNADLAAVAAGTGGASAPPVRPLAALEPTCAPDSAPEGRSGPQRAIDAGSAAQS